MSAAAQAPARIAALTGLPREIARQGMDSLAAALKIISDLTAQEIALVVGMVRERMTTRPAASAVETAGRMATGVTDAGKILLELAAGESAVVTDGLKEALRLRASAGAIADLFPRGLGTVIAMHEHILDMVGKQIQEFTESYAEGKPLEPRPRLAKMAREAVESFIDTQKTFLDQVAEQVTIATEAPKESKTSHKNRSKALIELSREGVGKFIEAQKQLLDLAVERAEEKAPARGKAAPRTSLAELTRKSVNNFTTAQKSLLDLALQRMPAAPEEAEDGHRRPKKTARVSVKAEARKTAREVARRTAAETARKAGREAGRKAGRAAGRAAAREEVAVELDEA